MARRREAEEKYWGGRDRIPKESDCGVYKITNTITSEFYIGASTGIRKRVKYHIFRKGTLCYFLHANIAKHKSENFKCEVLELCDKEDLRKREVFYIRLLMPSLNIAVLGSRKIRPRRLDLCTNKKQRDNFAKNGNITMRICCFCKNPCLNKTGQAANLEEKDRKQTTLIDFIME